jgi:hypothetical protein
MHRTSVHFIFIILGFAHLSLCGEIRGKVDIGPTLMDVDILESGKTVETLHMKGVKADATVLIYQGLCIKPGVMWGSGHGELWSGSVAVGYYLPITQKIKILPNVGCAWSYLHFGLDLEELQLFDLHERFRSGSPFIGMEFCYSLTDKWTLMAVYQYAWSHTQTKIRSKMLGTIVNDKSHSCGPNYSLGVDYSLNKNWSVIFGVGYNITLSKEKHGIRGKGAKLGIAYYF